MISHNSKLIRRGGGNLSLCDLWLLGLDLLLGEMVYALFVWLLRTHQISQRQSIINLVPFGDAWHEYLSVSQFNSGHAFFVVLDSPEEDSNIPTAIISAIDTN